MTTNSAHRSQTAKRQVKYAWIPLVILTLLLLLIGSSGPGGPVGEGSVLHAFLADDVTEEIVNLRFQGTVVWGMGIFSLFIILLPFRKGERWAWYALWYWPLFFVLHIIAFDTLFPDGVFALIAVLSLLVSARTVFGNQVSRTEPSSRRDAGRQASLTP